MIIKNCIMLASIVQHSLMFGRFLNSNIKKTQINGHEIANNGLMDSISTTLAAS